MVRLHLLVLVHLLIFHGNRAIITEEEAGDVKMMIIIALPQLNMFVLWTYTLCWGSVVFSLHLHHQQHLQQLNYSMDQQQEKISQGFFTYHHLIIREHEI